MDDSTAHFRTARADLTRRLPGPSAGRLPRRREASTAARNVAHWRLGVSAGNSSTQSGSYARTADPQGAGRAPRAG